MSDQVGSGHVAIFPTFSGFRSAVDKETAAAGKSGGRQFSAALKSATADAAPDLSRLKKSVASAAQELSKARMAEMDSAGKAKVAQTQLNEAIEKYGDSSSRAVAAKERLAAASRRLEAAQGKTKQASDGLRTAQDQLAKATESNAQQQPANASRFASAWQQVGGKLRSALQRGVKEGADAATSAAKKGGQESSDGFVSAFSSGLKKLAGLAAAAFALHKVGGAVGGAFSSGFERAINVQATEQKLIGLGHSGETVSQIMADALASVKGTAFGMGDAATVAASAVAAGIQPGKELQRTLTLIGDAAFIGNSSLGEMGSIFNKIATSNKLQAEELNQLGDRGIPIIKFLSEELGIAQDAVRDLASQGEIDFATFQAAMERGLGGAAQSSGKTFEGALANAKAAVGRFAAGFATPLVGLGTEVFQALIPVIDAVTQLAQPMIDGFSERLGELGPRITEAIGGAPELIGSIMTPIRSALELVGPLVEQWMANAGGLFSGLATALGPVLADLPGMLAPLVPILLQIMGTSGSLVQQVLPVVGSLLQQVLPPLLTMIGTILPPLAELFALLAAEVVPLTMQLVNGLAPILVELVTSLVPPLTQVLQSVIPVVGQLLIALAPLVNMMNTQLLTAIQMLLPAVSVVFQGIADIITVVVGIISSVISAFSAALSGDWDALWQNLLDAVQQIFSNLVPTVLNILGNLAELVFPAGKNIVGRLIDGILSMVGAVSEAIGSVVGKIADFLPHSPAKTGPLSGSGWGGWGEAIGGQLASELESQVSLVARASGALAGAASPDGGSVAGGRGAAGAEVSRLTQINHITAEDPRVTGRYLARELMGVLG